MSQLSGGLTYVDKMVSPLIRSNSIDSSSYVPRTLFSFSSLRSSAGCCHFFFFFFCEKKVLLYVYISTVPLYESYCRERLKKDFFSLLITLPFLDQLDFLLLWESCFAFLGYVETYDTV